MPDHVASATKDQAPAETTTAQRSAVDNERRIGKCAPPDFADAHLTINMLCYLVCAAAINHRDCARASGNDGGWISRTRDDTYRQHFTLPQEQWGAWVLALLKVLRTILIAFRTGLSTGQLTATLRPHSCLVRSSTHLQWPGSGRTAPIGAVALRGTRQSSRRLRTGPIAVRSPSQRMPQRTRTWWMAQVLARTRLAALRTVSARNAAQVIKRRETTMTTMTMRTTMVTMS
jgi:hypothetical protein